MSECDRAKLTALGLTHTEENGWITFYPRQGGPFVARGTTWEQCWQNYAAGQEARRVAAEAAEEARVPGLFDER